MANLFFIFLKDDKQKLIFSYKTIDFFTTGNAMSNYERTSLIIILSQ